MKKIILLFPVLLLCVQSALAQFNVDLNGSFAVTRYHPVLPTYNISHFPEYSSFTIGAEFEYKFRGKKKGQMFPALRVGASYLKTGYDHAYVLEDFLKTTSAMDKSYLRLPVLARVYYQPFVLVDHFKVYVGGGISLNKLLRAQLSESYEDETESYQDSGDMMDYANPQYTYWMIDVGLIFKRVSVGYRAQVSINEPYFSSLSGNWGVPDQHSSYISRHDSASKSREDIFELVLAVRLF